MSRIVVVGGWSEPSTFGNWGSAVPASATAEPTLNSSATMAAPSVADATDIGAAKTGGDGEVSDPIATLSASQLNTVHRILATIPDLTLKDDSLLWLEPCQETTVQLRVYNAPGIANVAWLAILTRFRD